MDDEDELKEVSSNFIVILLGLNAVIAVDNGFHELKIARHCYYCAVLVASWVWRGGAAQLLSSNLGQYEFQRENS